MEEGEEEDAKCWAWEGRLLRDMVGEEAYGREETVEVEAGEADAEGAGEGDDVSVKTMRRRNVGRTSKIERYTK